MKCLIDYLNLQQPMSYYSMRVKNGFTIWWYLIFRIRNLYIISTQSFPCFPNKINQFSDFFNQLNYILDLCLFFIEFECSFWKENLYYAELYFRYLILILYLIYHCFLELVEFKFAVQLTFEYHLQRYSSFELSILWFTKFV